MGSREKPSRLQSSNKSEKKKLVKMIEITDFQKIGVGLAGFGVAFLFLGMLLLFDKGLLAVGNILFLSGLAFVIGLERTFRFFFQYHKIKVAFSPWLSIFSEEYQSLVPFSICLASVRIWIG